MEERAGGGYGDRPVLFAYRQFVLLDAALAALAETHFLGKA